MPVGARFTSSLVLMPGMLPCRADRRVYSRVRSGHFCGMAEMLTPVSGNHGMPVKGELMCRATGRLHTEQHRLGLG